MFGTSRRAAVAGVTLALALSACGSSNASVGGNETTPPFVVNQSWGTFHLKASIADKVRKKQAINYVFSYQGTGIPLFSPQYKDGYTQGLTAGQKIYPMNGKAIAPVQTDPNQQVAQISALLTAGQIDCISIEPATSSGFTAIANQMMDQGIPVFTVGVTSNGHEFTNFTQVPLKEGAKAATTVLDYMHKNNLTFKNFAVSGGDPSQFWAQGRMTGFMNTIKAAIPDANFVNDPSTALNTSYDPAPTYDKAKAFLLGHPNVDVFQNSDIGAEHIDRAIKDLGKAGKTFTVGWNVSKANLDYIDAGIQIATMDQKWGEQAAFGGPACANFLASGKILPNTQELLGVTKENSAQARADLNKFLSGS
jgi:ribose transport system substrate-binding protein